MAIRLINFACYFFPVYLIFFIQLFAKLKLPEDRGVIQLAECLNSMHKAWVHSLALQKPGMVICTCDPSTQGLDGEKFSIIFDYIASSRPVWDPEDTVLNTTTKISVLQNMHLLN